MLHEAHEIQRNQVICRFRKLDALVRRLGGTTYQVEKEGVFDAPTRRVMILKSVGNNQYRVVRTVAISAEALAEAQQQGLVDCG